MHQAQLFSPPVAPGTAAEVEELRRALEASHLEFIEQGWADRYDFLKSHLRELADTLTADA